VDVLALCASELLSGTQKPQRQHPALLNTTRRSVQAPSAQWHLRQGPILSSNIPLYCCPEAEEQELVGSDVSGRSGVFNWFLIHSVISLSLQVAFPQWEP